IYLRMTSKLKLPRHGDAIENASNNIVVERPYHKTWWPLIDFFTSLPLDIIATVLGLSVPAKILSSMRLLRLVRVVKLRSIYSILDLLPKFIKIILAVSAVMVTLHWFACGWMLITPRPDLDSWSYYNVSIYWTVTTLTTVGYGDITPQTN